MKKTVTLLLFALFSLSAQAENWQFVIASDNEEIYVDTDTIGTVDKNKRTEIGFNQILSWLTGNGSADKYKRAESMFNYSVSARAPGTKFDYISDCSLFFFDCKRKRFGRAAQTLYSQPQCKGESLMTFSGTMQDIRFQKVAPDTIGENFFNFVCSINP